MGIEVCAYKSTAPYAEVCKTTSGTGEYTISELSVGSYWVSFFAPASSGLNYVGQSYAKTVSVTAGVTTPHIDAALKAGAQITGKVVAEGSNAPIEGIEVCAYPVGEAIEFEGFFAECAPTPTNGSGEYTISRLGTDEYKVQFYAPSRSALNYLGQYYNDKHSYVEAEVLHLTAGATTSGINATLAPGGEIAGRATAAATQAAISGLEVCAWAVSGEGGNCILTDATGAYTVPGLGNGSYRVIFSSPSESPLNYVTQYYNNKASEFEADPVAVKVGGVTPGIDATMQLGGTISGVVTSAPSKAALTHMQVCAYGSVSRCVTTNTSGEYTITALQSGSYKVYFYGTGEYAPQYYKEKVYSSEAQAVSITAGSSTPGIDAEMQPGATISGTVIAAATSAPLEGISVCRTAIHEEFFSSCTSTNAQGEYSFAGLASTEYKIAFSSYTSNYLTQYYHGKGSLAEAEPVAVAPGETKSEINAAMQAGGQIAGTVTSAATKLPVSGANVAVYTAGFSYLGSATTNAKGEYTVPRLATGSYKVSFDATSQNLVAEYYNQKPSSNEAAGVEVTTGATTSGIDAAMQLGGELKGKVIDATTKAPLANVSVTLAGNTTAFGYTSAAGEYDVKALSPGSYTASFFATGYEAQYYNGKTKSGEATPVVLAAGATTENINAAMQSLGSISGTVTDGLTHKGVSGVQVCDYGPVGICTTTNASGEYTISGLTAGTYKVGFYPGKPEYLEQVYNGKASLSEATAIPVASGATVSGIDAALQAPGHVKGTVTSKTSGLPLAGIEACVEPVSTGGSGGCATSDSNGHYDVGGLETGSYRVVFRAPESGETSNYIRQYYNGKTKFSEADSIAVVAGATKEGINAVLAEGGQIHGVIKTASSKIPIAHAGACAYTSETETYQCGYTNTSGEYTITALPSGKYIVYFFATEGEYTTQYYNGATTEAEATKVSVTIGATTNGIEGQLHTSGRITGTVTAAATSKALAGIEVCLFSQEGATQGCTTSASTGEYVLPAAAPGKHKVEFRSNAQAYETQYFNGKASLAEATTVEVSETLTTSGINAAMVAPGEITGRVTTEGGVTGIAGIQVCGFETGAPFAGSCATTGPTGEYDVTKLPGGTYHVSFYAPAGLNYIQQYYHEKSAYSEAEAVTVTAGAATGNINAALHVGGEISGKVVIAKTTTGIAGIEVCPYFVSAGGTAVGCAATNSSGEYLIDKLPTGEYRVGFSDPFNSALNYIHQYYSGHARLGEGQKLVVTAGGVTTGINAALEAGGEVAGKVIRIGTKAPLQGVEVCAYDHSSFESVGPCGLSNASGEYTLRGLPSGLVNVEFFASEYVSQCYNDSNECEFPTGVPVEVLHVTTGIDAALKSTHPIVSEATSLPTITGTPQQGSPLTEHHASWTHEPLEYRYQWLSCNSLGMSCLPIAHAESPSYTPVAQDVGSRLEVQETAINVEGEGLPVLSEPTAVVVPAKPVNLTPPSFTGSARAGQTLTETHGTWTNEPTSYTYQWERCDSSGENCIFPASSTEQAFKLSSTDVGHTIRAIETAINAGGESAPAVSLQSTVVVPEVPTSVSPPSITGSAVQGKELVESHGTWTNEPTSYGYQWERCSNAGTECTTIAEATSANYRLTHADVGHKLVIAETASNTGGASKPALSGPTVLIVAGSAGQYVTAYHYRLCEGGRDPQRCPRQLGQRTDELQLPMAALYQCGQRMQADLRCDRTDLHTRRSRRRPQAARRRDCHQRSGPGHRSILVVDGSGGRGGTGQHDIADDQRHAAARRSVEGGPRQLDKRSDQLRHPMATL